MLKDIGLRPGNPVAIYPGSPGAPLGCTGDLHTELDRTLGRLKALGTDFVVVTQWRWATNRPDGSWTFTAAEETFGSLHDADLAYLVKSAHTLGIKVLLVNQIQGFYDRSDPNNFFVPAATIENYRLWFSAYQAYVAQSAVLFQSLGVDIWDLGCNFCFFNDVII